MVLHCNARLQRRSTFAVSTEPPRDVNAFVMNSKTTYFAVLAGFVNQQRPPGLGEPT